MADWQALDAPTIEIGKLLALNSFAEDTGKFQVYWWNVMKFHIQEVFNLGIWVGCSKGN